MKKSLKWRVNCIHCKILKWRVNCIHCKMTDKYGANTYRSYFRTYHFIQKFRICIQNKIVTGCSHTDIPTNNRSG